MDSKKGAFVDRFLSFEIWYFDIVSNFVLRDLNLVSSGICQ